MSMAVAAEIKNWPNPDSMSPISWIIEAAILETKLARTWWWSGEMAESELLLIFMYVSTGTALITCLPQTSLCARFRETVAMRVTKGVV